jgi:hypothetical protein
MWCFNTTSERWSVIDINQTTDPTSSITNNAWVHPLTPQLLYMFGGVNRDQLW